MKCPKCNKDMDISKEDKSINTQNKKEYSRQIFHCKNDDVWVVVEIPIEVKN